MRRNVRQELIECEKGKTIFNSLDSEIQLCLSYCQVLLGIGADKLPKNDSEDLIITNFLRRVYPNVFLEEIKKAFEYAIEGRINVELNLYGNMFSASFVCSILVKYQTLKKGIVIPEKEIGITNHEAVRTVFSKMPPHMLDEIKKIGKIEEKKKIELPELPNNDFFQQCMKEFDELRFDKKERYKVPDCQDRFIKYKGKVMDLEAYTIWRIKNLKINSNK